MKKAIYMSDLHFEHQLWTKELLFQKDELAIYQHRLEEVTPRYTDRDILKKVEHFQNIFIRHNEVIDILQHDINEREHALSSFAKSHPIASDHVHFSDHADIREKVEIQGRIYSELKKDYLRFLTETM